jgi:hypothetical protein
MTTKKSSPTATKKPTPAKKPTPTKPSPTPRDADGATLADILAALKGIDAKLGSLVPKPLEKL